MDKKLIYDLGMLYIDVTMYLGFYLFFQSTKRIMNSFHIGMWASKQRGK